MEAPPLEMSPNRPQYLQEQEFVTPPRSSASYASSGGLPPFFDQSSSGIVRDGTTPNTSYGIATPAKDDGRMALEGLLNATPAVNHDASFGGPIAAEDNSAAAIDVLASTESGQASKGLPLDEVNENRDSVQPSVPSVVSAPHAEGSQRQTPAPMDAPSQASSGDTTSSEASPLKDKSPAEPQLYSVTGRPARNASVKKVVYSVAWDKDGNEIKPQDQKQREKERKEEIKAQKAAEKQQEKERKAEEREREKARKAAEREAKKNAKQGKLSTAPSSSVGSNATIEEGAPHAGPSTVESPPMRRSVREIKAPVDRHRSSLREEKAAARRRKAAEAMAESSDEDSEDDGSQADPENSIHDASAPNAASNAAESDDELDVLRPDFDKRHPPRNEDEEEVDPARPSKRPRQAEAPRSSAVEVKVPPLSPAKNSRSETSKRASGKASGDGGNTEGSDEEEAEDAKSDARAETGDKAETLQAPTKPPNSGPQTPRPAATPNAQDDSSGRRSFAGTPLSSLLTSTSNRHRRPGLGRRSFIPPLHPNRQPAPPPKMAPTLTRKEKDALKKEMQKRGEIGSDEDGSDDDENKPKYNPFEEEIEGY